MKQWNIDYHLSLSTLNISPLSDCTALPIAKLSLFYKIVSGDAVSPSAYIPQDYNLHTHSSLHT